MDWESQLGSLSAAWARSARLGLIKAHPNFTIYR
ncbi:glioma pathogenesis-related protein 1-like protein [Corchorus olitorius]|uniref:Glioma pathogenesis-related protein 1-like protein n=1 Tax=Corchorus olitorius TaxID=93759 RepID=A0A1R3JF62_9ROSI|nr:glioma pathogenesis-related protein 1-like protein [Corchorus olitorius]